MANSCAGKYSHSRATTCANEPHGPIITKHGRIKRAKRAAAHARFDGTRHHRIKSHRPCGKMHPRRAKCPGPDKPKAKDPAEFGL